MISQLCWYLVGKKFNLNFFQLRKFVRETQFWTEQQMSNYHNTHLQSLIIHAYNYVPFYKNLFDTKGLKPSDISSVADLSKLPIIRKADLINNSKDFIATNKSELKYMSHHTGGTTGTPLNYFNDRKSWALNWAIKMRTFEWAGFRYGTDRLAVLAGGSLIPGKNYGKKHTIWRFLHNYYTVPIVHLSPELMLEHIKQIKKQKIKFMRGYPSAITTFAEFVVSQKEYISLKAIFTTAEILYPHQRDIMKKAFGCDVYDTYGCGDGMGAATECELHKGLHISQENSIMQIVDSDGINSVVSLRKSNWYNIWLFLYSGLILAWSFMRIR